MEIKDTSPHLQNLDTPFLTQSFCEQLVLLLEQRMSQSQLMMRRGNFEGLEEAAQPSGYEIRIFRPGEESAWVDIINDSFGSGWTVGMCKERLTGAPQFDPEGLFFATFDDEPVGTTCAWRDRPEDKKTGYVHMVGVMKAHRGKRLGKMLTLKALHYFRERNFEEARLLTDDFRLSAIRAYLDCGFKPVFREEGHKNRWVDVYLKLGREDEATKLREVGSD